MRSLQCVDVCPVETVLSSVQHTSSTQHWWKMHLPAQFLGHLNTTDGGARHSARSCALTGRRGQGWMTVHLQIFIYRSN